MVWLRKELVDRASLQGRRGSDRVQRGLYRYEVRTWSDGSSSVGVSISGKDADDEVGLSHAGRERQPSIPANALLAAEALLT